MGALMRQFDWSKTPLGPVSEWPQSLKTAVRIVLTSQYPMFVWWGRERVNIYNDSYRPFLGSKHPAALGKPAREAWAEIWHEVGPRSDAVLLRGESTYDEGLLLLMDRHGYLEETYFTFSYSPVPDDAGETCGVFCAVTEATDQVIGERRLRLLREVAAATADVRTRERVCTAAGECLTNARRDLPFSLMYLLDGDGRTLRRAAHSGIEAAHAAAPESVDVTDGSIWPFQQVMDSGEPVIVTNLERLPELPTGQWERRPSAAVLMPIAQQGQRRPAGVFVAGLNPHREFGEDFRGFVTLLVNQIAAAISNAVAYEAERRRAEQLAELDKAKTLFFSNVSHEFRTPLTLMLGPIEEVLPEAQERLTPKAQEHLLAARRNALRLLKLVNNLLDFSRIEAGRVQATYRQVDICEITSNVASVFRSAIETAGIQYVVDCESISSPVYVDVDMWEKIVLNLLSNAFKFTFAGEIAVHLREDNGNAELTVRDTGVGIPEHEQDRVFERFHRIENARSRTFEGTGIGLALVQELVKLHGGTVRVASTPEKGSTFSVTIPSGKAHLPAERVEVAATSTSTATTVDAYIDEMDRWLGRPERKTSPRNTRGAHEITRTTKPEAERATIVLADDNADMRDYLEHLLEEEYQVCAVSDGEQALEAARQVRPALILTDVMMPKLDGFGLLKRVRSEPELRNTPVIVLSARAGEESQVEGLQAGADDYLVKPFTARELLARVATHVKIAKARRDSEERESRLRAAAEWEQARLRDLLQQAPAAIGLLNGPEHRWTYVNDRYVSVTGRHDASDFVGKTITESLPEIATQGFVEILDDVYQSGRPYFGREVRVRLNRGPDGQPDDVYFDFVYQPIRSTAGEVEGVLVHAVEVTDRVANRRRLEASEERFRLAQMAAQIGTWEWDPTKNIQALSPELHDTFGTDANDPDHAVVWSSRVYPEDRAMVYRKMEEGYRDGKLEFEYRYEHPQRGIRWLYCKGSRVQDNPRMLGVVLDVTERKRTEQEFHEASILSQRLAAIVTSSDDAIASKNLQGIVTSWNPAAERIFGYTAEEMIGQSILKVIPPELHSDEDRILATITRGDRIEHFDTVRLRKDGTRFDVSLTVSPVRDEKGKIIGAAKIARDITQRKKAEQALRTTERLASVGRMAATVAHEINNPLEAVTNLVFLAKTTTSQKEVEKYLAMAEEELDRISHLTKQTLGFYRETRGASKVDVASLVPALISVFASRAKNKGIEIRQEIREHNKIQAVAGEIRRVLANLISNSIDATEKGGVLRVRVSSATRRRDSTRGVRITVADTGAGIPSDVRKQLFQPFFTTKKDVGTGLGLWVCKSIVENHGGEVRLRSCTSAGKSGTVFSVFLPENAQPVEQDFRRAV